MAELRGPMSILRELLTNEKVEPEVKTTYVLDLKDRLQGTCELAQIELQKSQIRQKKYYDRKTNVRTFEKGDEVLVLLPTDSTDREISSGLVSCNCRRARTVVAARDTGRSFHRLDLVIVVEFTERCAFVTQHLINLTVVPARRYGKQRRHLFIQLVDYLLQLGPIVIC